LRTKKGDDEKMQKIQNIIEKKIYTASNIEKTKPKKQKKKKMGDKDNAVYKIIVIVSLC